MRPHVQDWAETQLKALEAAAQDHQIVPGEMVEILAKYIGTLAALAFPDYLQPRVLDGAKEAMDANYEATKRTVAAQVAKEGEVVQ